MPRGRAKALEGDGFNQPNAPSKRRKKSRASPATPDMIPPQMQPGNPNYGQMASPATPDMIPPQMQPGNPNYGQMMGPSPFDDPRGFPPNSMPYSPNGMTNCGPYPNQMGPMGPNGPPGTGRGGPMPGGQGPYPYQGVPGGMNHRMPTPGQGPASYGNNGKVYPESASMVFNPSNPNAPPIYPCGICHKEVHDNDQAILCESGCNFWYHRPCTGLTEIAFVMLTQEVYAEWACDQCLSSKNIPLVKMKS